MCGGGGGGGQLVLIRLTYIHICTVINACAAYVSIAYIATVQIGYRWSPDVPVHEIQKNPNNKP